MRTSARFAALFFFCWLGFVSSSHAQDGGGATYPEYFDLGARTGSFLPSDIPQVRDSLGFWGVYIAHPIGYDTALEYNFDMMNGEGVNYLLAYAHLRHDFAVADTIPLFFIIGIDLSNYRPQDVYGSITGNLISSGERKTAFGWHLGLGAETNIYEDLYVRTDLRWGFGPGNQMSISIGLAYRFQD